MSNKMKKKYGERTKNNIFIDYKKSAKYRNHMFELTFDELISMVQKECYYCGSPPSNIEKSPCNNGDFIHNGIDRTNNNEGYTSENCVPCCWTCNQLKGKLSKKEFINQIKCIYQHKVL